MSEWISDYQEDSFIDSRDTMNTWCTGRVLAINFDSKWIRIRYDGWSEKWDNTFSFTSNRIAPFRKKSELYTGQKGTAIRDWEFSLEEIAASKETMENLPKTAFKITQFIRGKLFTLVDCLLVYDYKTQSDLKASISFFTKVLDFIVTWLKNFKEHFAYYNEYLTNPESFLTNPQVALSCAWPELLFTLKRLFALDLRTSRPLLSWEIIPKVYSFTTLTEQRNKTLFYLINYFSSIGGFDVFNEILRENEDIKKAPFRFIYNLPVYEIRAYFTKAFDLLWTTTFKNLVIERIQEISDKEIKMLEKDMVSNVIGVLRIMIDDSDDDWDSVDLGLALKLLKCPYMEKKLKGLSEIKDFIENISEKESSVKRKYKFLNSEVLARWIIENKVLETVVENAHEEMIKRLSCVFIFLAENQKLETSHLDLILKYAQNHHDSLLISVYKVITDISPHISFKLQHYLYKKLIETPAEDYDEKFLRMISEFSIKSISQEREEYFALNLLYDLCLDSAKPKLHEISTKCFVDLLKHTKSFDSYGNYIEKSVKNIQNNDSVCQSMMIIQKILNLNITYRCREDLFKKLNSSSEGIFKLISKSFLQGFNLEKRPVFTQTKNIKTRLKFWKFIVTKQCLDVTIDDIVDLKNNILSSNYGIKAIKKYWNTLLKLIKTCFSPGMNNEILEKIYLAQGNSTEAADKISKESFEVFYEVFLKVNYELKCLEIKYESFHARNNINLRGFDYLVSIVFGSVDKDIVSKSMKLLINLNLKLSRTLLLKREDIWGDFLNTLHTYMVSSLYPIQVNKSLTLVLQFLENNIKREEFSQHNCAVAFKQISETEFIKFTTNYNISLGSIRKRIADHYKKNINTIIISLINTSEKYDYLYDDIPLNSLKSPYYFIVDIVTARQDIISPGQYFSKCQIFQESLLEMLSMFDKNSADLAWTILNKVSLIEKYLNSLRTFSLPYNEVFSTSSLYKLVYNLKIIEQLIKNPKWIEDFAANGGIIALINVYLEYSFEKNDKNALVLEYNVTIISILSDIVKLETLFSDKLLTKVFDSLVQATNACGENENSGHIARNAKAIALNLKTKDQDRYLATIKRYPIRDLLLGSFVNCACKYLSSAMLTFFIEQSMKIQELNGFFLEAILGIFDEALLKNKIESYWDLLCFYIIDCEVTPELEGKYLGFIKILEQRPAEGSGKEHDTTLSGILKVLKTTMKKIHINISEDIIRLILHTCLFEIPSKLIKDAPKCKNSDTRKEAFDLLKEICNHNKKALEYVISYLSSQYQDPHWRSSRLADWNYHPRAHEKSDTGYVGIKNLGCICYMISSLQQLFFVSNFRETILRINKPDEPLEDNLLYQLQNVYSALKNSDKQHVNPKGICKAFKDWEGRAVNVLEQMDADEFINAFMDRLETRIKGHPCQDIVKELFTGQLATELIGQQACKHRSEVNEAFITLPVQVKNKKSLIESLESFKEGEVLEGSNAYQCDHCESKVTAIRRVCIKYLPNIIFITLRRFEFDYDSMKRLKLNDYCEFPMELNMENFTQEGIERLEYSKEKEAAALAGKDFTKEAPTKRYPDDYYQYRLRGIIIHVGTADSGHYYSFIREQNQWFEFNDTLVRPLDPSDIPNEAFGGEEKFSYQAQSGITAAAFKSKHRNAYILLYERSKFYVYRKEEEILKPLVYTYDTNEIEFSEVKEENERYWRCKSSFSPEYFDFILQLLNEKNNAICKFGICFFLTVMIRSRDYMRIATCIQSIKDQLKDNFEISEWVLEMVSYKYVLKELLMDCPVTEKRRAIVGLIHFALKQTSLNIQEQFFKRLIKSIDLARKPFSYNYAQYFEIIYRTLKLFPNLIIKYSIPDRLISYIRKIPYSDIEIEPYKNTDIYLGYDKYKPEDKSEIFLNENTSSLVFLISSLQLSISELSSDQIEYFFEETTMTSFLNDAGSRYGGKVLGQFYTTLCTDNKILTLKYGNFLINGIDKANHDKHKPYMRQLFWILAQVDKFCQEKVDILMTSYMKQIQNNKKYVMATDSSIDFLVKIFAKIPAIKDWVNKRRQELRWLENLYADSLNRPSSKSKEQVMLKTPGQRLEIIKKILRGLFGEKDWEDSDSDNIDENTAQNAKVEVFDGQSQRWIPCTVHLTIGELLLVKNENEGLSKWVENLSENVRALSKKRPN
ncbi:hypothetical protein SteCoe_26477 [Stentor coeruleus]|uniref:USP domain-containing protein n=1 Tax=Stentor coeruleus TaxID=5963 RepID=A0A1R2BCS9_9CILI|nr:hypothetical protein SteCoe_26477 [Stentor coeruleus]